MGMGCQRNTTSILSEERLDIHGVGGWVGLKPLWTCGENSNTPQLEPRIIQVLASRYNFCAFPTILFNGYRRQSGWSVKLKTNNGLGLTVRTTLYYNNLSVSSVVYPTVVTSHAANKWFIRYGNTLNIVSNLCVCHVWCTGNSELCNVVDLSCTCPTYHTDKQYKVKTNSLGGRV